MVIFHVLGMLVSSRKALFFRFSAYQILSFGTFGMLPLYRSAVPLHTKHPEFVDLVCWTTKCDRTHPESRQGNLGDY